MTEMWWFMTMIPGLVPASKPSKPAQLNQYYYQNCNNLAKMSPPETENPILFLTQLTFDGIDPDASVFGP